MCPLEPYRRWLAGRLRSARQAAGLVDGQAAAAGRWVATGVMAAAALWSYWPTLKAMAKCWANDPQYSHGFLVPLFALFIVAMRRPENGLPAFRLNWWGVPWLLVAALLRLTAAASYFDFLDALSLLPFLMGMLVLFGGRPALYWAWPAVGFLAFMLPLPYAVEVALAQPLQRLATTASTYALQVLGIPALAEGNVIVIDQVKLGVVDACSGLGMLVTFFALSTAVALVLGRPWPDRLAIFLSAIPIAIFANVARITLTGVLYRTAGAAWASAVWHDLAGWLMMPLALGLFWLELKFLDRLLPPAEPAGPVAPYLAGAHKPCEFGARQATEPESPAAVATGAAVKPSSVDVARLEVPRAPLAARTG